MTNVIQRLKHFELALFTDLLPGCAYCQHNSTSLIQRTRQEPERLSSVVVAVSDPPTCPFHETVYSHGLQHELSLAEK
jgi:hypothetical protein